MIRITRKCRICQGKFALKYFARKNLHQTTVNFVRERFNSEKCICDFCVIEIYNKNHRPSEKFLSKLNAHKRTKALSDSGIRSPAVN